MTPESASHDAGNRLDDTYVITKLKSDLVSFRTDIAERNYYINERDEYLFGDGLWQNIDLPDGYDKTFYNYLRRIVDVHTSALMGEAFSVYSSYTTQDISQLDPKQDAAKIAQIQGENKMAETKATIRRSLIQAMIRDNGGHRLFADGARSGGSYGSTLYQMYWDDDKKKICIHNLESIQNWFPIWSDNNFRERMGDAYVWQIALEKANKDYGDKLDLDEMWPVTYAGDPLINLQGGSSALTNQPGETVSAASTRRPMVTQIDYTGYLANIAYTDDGKAFQWVQAGKETKLSFKILGNKIVSRITDETKMPNFYYIPNREVPRRPYGESDLVEAALEINQTLIQLRSDQKTLADKELYPLLLGKNYENASLPARRPRQMGFIPMGADQDIKVLELPMAALQAYETMAQNAMNDLLAVVGIPRVMFFEANQDLNSSQAMMTSMRPMMDIVEDKQKNWEPVLRQMFEDALKLTAIYQPELKDVMSDDEDWWLYVRWPNALRKNDPQYKAMLINELRAGVKSVQTFMEESGYINPDMEIDRIEQDLSDKTRAAILGGALGELAHFTIFEKLGIPLYGFNLPKISLKGDLTPRQEGNIGANQGWNTPDQPYGADIGPQGLAGERANENEIDQGFISGGTDPYAKYGFPTGYQPGSTISPGQNGGQPQVTPGNPAGANQPQGAPSTAGGGGAAPSQLIVPGQNNPGAQPMSMPGSGATPTSPAGEVAKKNQHQGA